MKNKIFIPCYNCAPQVERLVNDLYQICPEIIEDVVLIDNSSSDNTLDVLTSLQRKHHKKFKIIAHTNNYGLGGSFKSAVSYSKEHMISNIFWFHGDYQAELSDLLKMIELQKEKKIACIFGSRFMPNSRRSNYSIFRFWGNIIIMIIYTLILKKPVYELGSGLNMYSTESLPSDIEDWPNHIAFDANLLFHYIYKKPQWMPIAWNNLDQVSNARNIRVALDLLQMLIKFKITHKPVKNKIPMTLREYRIYE